MPTLDDPFVINVVAGGLAGAATAVFVCPLDVLKTRMQVQTIQTGQLRYNLRSESTAHDGNPGLVQLAYWRLHGAFVKVPGNAGNN